MKQKIQLELILAELKKNSERLDLILEALKWNLLNDLLSEASSEIRIGASGEITNNKKSEK